MPSTYTGVAANVSLASGVTETLPADGEAANVASVNGALQKVADYLEALRVQRGGGIAIGSYTNAGGGTFTAGTPAEVAPFFAAGSANYGTGVTTSNATGRITVAAAGLYRIDAFAVMGSTVASNPVTLYPRKNGVLMTTTGDQWAAGIASTGTALVTLTFSFTDTAAANDYYSLFLGVGTTGIVSFSRGALMVTRIG